MKKFYSIIIITFILLLTSCHNLENEVKVFLAKKDKEFIEVNINYNEEEKNYPLIRWAVPVNKEKMELSEEKINEELGKIGRGYKIKFIYMPTNSNSNRIIGQEYIDFTKNLIERQEVDIINRGIKSGYDFSLKLYANKILNEKDLFTDKFLLESLKDEDIFEQVPEKYMGKNPIIYKGKVLGFGNRVYSIPYGVFYTKSFVEKIGLKKLSSDINEHIDLFEKEKSYNENPIIFLNIDYIDILQQLKTPFYLYTFDSKGESIVPFFENEDYIKFCNYLYLPYSKGWISDNLNSNMVASITNLEDCLIKEKVDSDTYLVNYSELGEGYFKILGYKYLGKNFINTENFVIKNSKNKDDAFDFLNLIYFNRDFINNIKEVDYTIGGVSAYLNENLLSKSEIVFEEYGERENYLNFYKDNKFDGLYFDENSEEFDKLYDKIIEIYRNESYYSDILNLLSFKNNNYEVKEKIKNSLNDIKTSEFIKRDK